MAGAESQDKDVLNAAEKRPTPLGVAVAALIKRLLVLNENNRVPITPKDATTHEQAMRDARDRNDQKPKR